MNQIDAAVDAAISLAQSAAAALQQQRQGQGLSPKAYRKHIRAIRDLTWCAINDLGQAKRMAVLARRPGMYQRRIRAALLRDVKGGQIPPTPSLSPASAATERRSHADGQSAPAAPGGHPLT